MKVGIGGLGRNSRQTIRKVANDPLVRGMVRMILDEDRGEAERRNRGEARLMGKRSCQGKSTRDTDNANHYQRIGSDRRRLTISTMNNNVDKLIAPYNRFIVMVQGQVVTPVRSPAPGVHKKMRIVVSSRKSPCPKMQNVHVENVK